MKICIICNEYPPAPHGGIGTMTRVLGRALCAAGHEVRVVGMYNREVEAPDVEDDRGVRVLRLRRSARRLGWPSDRYRLYQTVAAWARRGEIDLVELPDWEGWAAGWPRLPVPVISRLNGAASYFADELGRRPHGGLFRLERASLRRSDFICSVSRYTADRTSRMFGLTSGIEAILHNPVDLPEPPDDRARSPHRVVFTGTLTAKKGVLTLFRAWPDVAARHRLAELHIIGKDGRTDDGRSMRSHLMTTLPDALRERVHFHGHLPREDVFRALGSARVAVFPSYSEAFAIAPLEAMAAGCPTIFTKRGSGPELISDGLDGLLIDPDSPAEIAAAASRLLADDALALSLGRAGRARVERSFAMDRLLARNEQFYRECSSRFSRGGDRPVAHKPRPTFSTAGVAR